MRLQNTSTRILRVHTYSDFDTKMFESLIEHALMNKFIRLPWKRSTWVGDFRTFTSLFSKRSCYMRPQATGLLRFQKFPLWRAFSKVCGYSVRFRRIRVDESRIRNKMFADTNESWYVWTGPKCKHRTKRKFSLTYIQIHSKQMNRC